MEEGLFWVCFFFSWFYVGVSFKGSIDIIGRYSKKFIDFLEWWVGGIEGKEGGFLFIFFVREVFVFRVSFLFFFNSWECFSLFFV